MYNQTPIDSFFLSRPTRSYNARHIFIFPGEVSDSVYKITEGRVKKYFIDSDGNEIVVQIYSNKDLLLLSHVINKSAGQFYYEADVDVRAHRASAQDFEHFLATNPEVVLGLLEKVLQSSSRRTDKILRLMHNSAKQRVIYEVVYDSRHFASVKNNDYVLSINETQLATKAGLARETVSRVIGELKRDNMLQIRSNKILVKDLLGLESKLNEPV